MNIGLRIKSLRESNGLTQEELGKVIGVNKATVNRYETGVIDIKRTVAIKLAEALNTSPAYLMGWEEAVKELPPEDLFKGDPASEAWWETVENKPEVIKGVSQMMQIYNQLSSNGKEKVIDYTTLIYNSEKATE